MKIQIHKQQLLRNQLSKVVLYKETYEEIYDHVLTALEQRPEIENLQSEVHQVLKNDFGGYAGITKMETDRRNLIKADIRLEYLKSVKTGIHNPMILLLLLAFAIAYYSVGDVYKEYSVIQIAAGLILVFIPWAFFAMAKQMRTFRSNDLKEPIALAALQFDVVVPALWYLLFEVMSIMLRQYFWNHGFRVAERITDGINTVLFITILFNVYLFFSIYYSKLKTSIH